MAMPLGPPSINTSSRATTAQASFENGPARFFEALNNTMAHTLAEMQVSRTRCLPSMPVAVLVLSAWQQCIV
jgi:hypothetical protein